MVTGVGIELEQAASGHEQLNQQSNQKSGGSQTEHKPGDTWGNWASLCRTAQSLGHR